MDSGAAEGQVLDAHQDEGRDVGCDHDVGLKSNAEGRGFSMPLAICPARVSTRAVFTLAPLGAQAKHEPVNSRTCEVTSNGQ